MLKCVLLRTCSHARIYIYNIAACNHAWEAGLAVRSIMYNNTTYYIIVMVMGRYDAKTNCARVFFFLFNCFFWVSCVYKHAQ